MVKANLKKIFFPRPENLEYMFMYLDSFPPDQSYIIFFDVSYRKPYGYGHPAEEFTQNFFSGDTPMKDTPIEDIIIKYETPTLNKIKDWIIAVLYYFNMDSMPDIVKLTQKKYNTRDIYKIIKEFGTPRKRKKAKKLAFQKKHGMSVSEFMRKRMINYWKERFKKRAKIELNEIINKGTVSPTSLADVIRLSNGPVTLATVRHDFQKLEERGLIIIKVAAGRGQYKPKVTPKGFEFLFQENYEEY